MYGCISTYEKNTCRRGRHWCTCVSDGEALFFGSSRRLNLGLICTAKTPARDTLGVWPDLSLFIQSYGDYRAESVDNLIAVLESAAIMRGKSKHMGTPRSHFRKKV